jgi:hypothetical protein
MPNDRASASILKNIDLKKYPKLNQFLTIQSVADNKQSKILSNQQALDLLEEAIGEVENQTLSSATSSSRASRQKELDQSGNSTVSESKIELSNQENPTQKELQLADNKELSVERGQNKEQQFSAEAIQSSESAEIAEIGQELAEIQEVDEKQEAEELIKKKQATIDNLVVQAQSSSAPVKPVVVLPITERQKEEAKKKSVHFSLRWLAEWAEKIRKIFAGAVLYKEEAENSVDV